MTVDTTTIQEGMDVYDVTGEKVGSLTEVVAPSTGTDTEPAGTARGDATDARECSYLRVERGGVLGIGAKELYIPVSAVQHVVPGDNVMIDCTKDRAEELYDTRPEAVGDKR